jgi:plastocyanin
MRGGIRGALAAAALTFVTWIAAPSALAGGGGCFHHVTAGIGTGDAVAITDGCFGPNVLYVDPGTTVTWTNQDPVPHSVFGVGGGWGSGDPVLGGSRVSYTFGDSGTFVYVCTLHIGMAGAVVVGDGRGAAGLDPTSVTSAGLAAAPTGRTTSPPSSQGMSAGTILGLVALGLAGAIGLWAIRADRRRRSQPQVTAR